MYDLKKDCFKNNLQAYRNSFVFYLNIDISIFYWKIDNLHQISKFLSRY